MNQTTMTDFEQFALSQPVLRAIREMAFQQPTPIQAEAIPLMRSGRDMIGRSQTGTGKTMAFAIPAIEMLLAAEDRSKVLAIVMLPTRELAMQCCGEFKKLSKYCEGIRPVEVYGGAPMDRQIQQLKRANIVIGTPGRIMDHLRRRTLKLDHVRLAVLDEADEMLSMGFKEDMETILRETPEQRQTVLFSATMPEAILSITDEFLTDPEVVQINSAKVTLDNIEQTYVNVPMGRKTDALKLLLYYYSPSRAIVFCNTKKMAEELYLALSQGGFRAEALHGDMKQSQRSAVMEQFRSGATAILVATDVAARGIDVSDVEYVFNYDIPQNNEYYVHRIGRTGRVGKAGRSVTICSGRRQVLALQLIAREVKSTVKEIPVPNSDDINYRTAEQQLDTIEKVMQDGINDKYRNMVNLLLERGNSLFDIAAAVLQMQFSETEIHINDIQGERRSAANKKNQNFSKLLIDIGRSSHVAPNHLVASITERSMLHGSDIGKIEIYDDHSLVAVPAESADDVVVMMYGAKVCGKPVKISLFEEQAPRHSRQSRSSGSRSAVKPHSKGQINNHSRKRGAKRHGK